MAGILLIVLANFAASFATSPPVWDAEAVMTLLTGLATIGTSILLAVRPTKGTLTLAAVDVVWLLLLGNLL